MGALEYTRQSFTKYHAVFWTSTADILDVHQSQEIDGNFNFGKFDLIEILE